MVLGSTKRLSKLAREFNVGIHTIVEFLHKKGYEIDSNPNTKVEDNLIQLLENEYKSDISLKKESEKIQLKSLRPKKEIISIEKTEEPAEEKVQEVKEEVKEKPPVKPQEVKKAEPKPEPKEIVEEKFEVPKENKLKVVGKIDLEPRKPVKPVEKEVPAKEVSVVKEEPVKVVEKPVEVKENKIKVEAEKIIPEKTEVVTEKVEEKPVEVKKAEEPVEEHIDTNIPKVDDVKVVGRIDLESLNQKTRPAKKSKEEREKDRLEKKKKKPRKPENIGEPVKQDTPKLTERPPHKPVTEQAEAKDFNQRKKRRRRIQKDNSRVDLTGKPPVDTQKTLQKKYGKKRVLKKEISEEDVQKQIKDTLARLTSKGKSKGSKYRRDKRAAVSERAMAVAEQHDREKNIIKVTEFVSAAEFATMMNVPVTQVISTCMSLGLFVSINQRLDAETMAIVGEEFGYKIEFVSVEIQEAIEEIEDTEDDLKPRPPIVTVMGHVDHGKTSLLDYIRQTNVIAGEAGGITQHIGAYHVSLKDGRQITFLDTPGHEAFTAMRARGAQVTDIAIIIVAADDNIMPQTIEAINHAQAAGVPIVFAINKIDKPGANPEKIKEGLANMNFLVEEWGGKYQSQDISAKAGTNVEELLEKVLLEAEMLDLKANPEKRANGTVIESTLDKGRGYTATLLVENGTMRQGDIVIAGQFYGHVKAMFNERNQRIDEVGPAEPVIILGLDGAPQAGDKFNVMETEREARNIANKREQLAREQGLRTQKHITLDEIGRRIAIGNFQELNLIVKGDVDGSIEALSDSLIKLSTEEIQVNVIHKSVGAISESDIMLATASEAIVIGFQVRPTLNARKVAEREQIDIRLYSIIYDAINEIKAAMEGMLSPEIKEEISGTAEVLEVFKITKVGSVAGCIVRDGKIARASKVRVIRDGIVIYTGELGSLKRFKEDVKEVKNGYECGLNVENFNDIKVGDNIEAFKEVEVAKTL
ncbi:MAG: translation initiation factor IF-2 [Prolixibacteraceae bacterium]|nr:translation initiation factor IF-2 [Prolixibacteraceae bacterium]MBN2774769.1 translation initiation factor IF-2 [Prolixibacteraceae bacterium]